VCEPDWQVEKGLTEPLWVMTNLDAQRGLHIYFGRMKIEQSFRDLKTLLGMPKLMNQKQEYMEKMIALLLLVFAIGFLLGENLRDFLYGVTMAENEQVAEKDRIPDNPHQKQGKKWKRYSGLFILLRQKWKLASHQFAAILAHSLTDFLAIVHLPVRT
jgi:hypothetical protein